jgi:hypothetical protein
LSERERERELGTGVGNILLSKVTTECLTYLVQRRGSQRNSEEIEHAGDGSDGAASSRPATAAEVAVDASDDLQGVGRVIAAGLLTHYLLLPALHVGLLLLLDAGGGPIFAEALEDKALRFVHLVEGAVPSSMTVMAIAMTHKNVKVERLLGVVTITQYALSPLFLTVSTSVSLLVA